MDPMWFLRMVQWVRHPPSRKVAAIWIGVIVICVLVAGAEWLWGWPDWLTVNGRARLAKP